MASWPYGFAEGYLFSSERSYQWWWKTFSQPNLFWLVGWDEEEKYDVEATDDDKEIPVPKLKKTFTTPMKAVKNKSPKQAEEQD